MEAEERSQAEAQAKHMQFQHPEHAALAAAGYGADGETANMGVEQATMAVPQPVLREGPKIGRNDPCPCGSGKKYKQCHGQLV